MSVPYNHEAVERLMDMWKKYHHDYVSLIPHYRELIGQKRILGIALNKIKESELKEFPVIPFLGIKTEKEAKEFVYDMTQRQVMALIGRIDIMVNNDYVWRRLTSWCKDAECQIRRYSMPKTYYRRTSPDEPIRNSLLD